MGGRNQYTGPAYSTKACFMAVGNIITIVNKDRRAWGQCTWDVYDLHRREEVDVVGARRRRQQKRQKKEEFRHFDGKVARSIDRLRWERNLEK